MKRNFQAFRAALAVFGLVAVFTFATVPFPVELPASEQAPAKIELPTELQYVPVDAALFLSVDAAQVWDYPILRAIRKADTKIFDGFSNAAKMAFGLTPDDVKSVVVFVPKLDLDEGQDGLGVVITCRNAYDKEKLAKGVETLLPKGVKFNVVPASDRMAVVLVNLGEEFARRQLADKTGPLTSALQEAATGKHAAVIGIDRKSVV